jgi:hypothetical protein
MTYHNLTCRFRWQRGLRRRSYLPGHWNPGFESHTRLGCCVFCVVLSCVGRGLCDGLITHPKESYSVLIRLRRIRCEAAKVLTRIVELNPVCEASLWLKYALRLLNYTHKYVALLFLDRLRKCLNNFTKFYIYNHYISIAFPGSVSSSLISMGIIYFVSKNHIHTTKNIIRVF